MKAQPITHNTNQLEMSDLLTFGIGSAAIFLMDTPLIPSSWEDLLKLGGVALLTFMSKLGLAWIEYKRKQWGLQKATRKRKTPTTAKNE
jgi:hypothetical protein